MGVEGAGRGGRGWGNVPGWTSPGRGPRICGINTGRSAGRLSVPADGVEMGLRVWVEGCTGSGIGTEVRVRDESGSGMGSGSEMVIWI